MQNIYLAVVYLFLIILTVKSLFIPPYALQGEDIPGHIIWDKLNFRSIRIELPETMLKNELFNVREEMIETAGNTVIVRNEAIEVDGYLGMLFSSRKSEDSAVRSQIVFSFIGEDNAILLKQSREIYLFRPNIDLVDTPSEIKVDIEKGFVNSRIKIAKNDEGTLLLKIISARDSELQIRTPSSMVEYRKRLLQNLQEEYSSLKGEYPLYSDIVERHFSILSKGWTSQEDLKEWKQLADDLNRTWLENEDFVEKLLMALLNSLWRSQRFLSMPERLLKYLESVVSKKIWLFRPENVIMVSPEPRILKLEIMPSDRLFHAYDTIKTPDIRISGTKEGQIEIVKLFEWI
jgi:hypothetical protein